MDQLLTLVSPHSGPVLQCAVALIKPLVYPGTERGEDIIVTFECMSGISAAATEQRRERAERALLFGLSIRRRGDTYSKTRC